MNKNLPLQARPWDLKFLEIRPWSWFFDRARGAISNSVRIRKTPCRQRVFVGRRAPDDPVRQYYELESLCQLTAYRADRIGRFINGKSGQRLIRFLDGKSFRAACWAVIIVAVLYFGAGIIKWLVR